VLHREREGLTTRKADPELACAGGLPGRSKGVHIGRTRLCRHDSKRALRFCDAHDWPRKDPRSQPVTPLSREHRMERPSLFDTAGRMSSDCFDLGDKSREPSGAMETETS